MHFKSNYKPNNSKWSTHPDAASFVKTERKKQSNIVQIFNRAVNQCSGLLQRP